MNNIEDIIKSSKQKDIVIPTKIQNRINYTLRNKRSEINYFRKFATVIVSILCALIGSLGVYAMTSGKIENIPVIDLFGFKFSNKYVEYKQDVKNEVLAAEKTSVELVSVLSTDGITLLEFKLNLSEDDYKKLKIDESIITDNYLQEQEENKSKLRDLIISELKSEKFLEIYKYDYSVDYNTVKDDIYVSEDEINEKYEERVARIEESIELRKNTTYIPVLSLNYNQNASVYIDDESYSVKNWQRIEKINKYEYKIYVIYLLTNDVLKGKEEFKLILKNNKVTSIADWESLEWKKGTENFASQFENMVFDEIEPTDVIELPGEFDVTILRSDILKDSTVIENPNIKSEFRNITHTVEKVVNSPVQITVTIKHSATNQSSNAFANRYDNPNIEHLPTTKKYKIYDANGKELKCIWITNQESMIYSDGTEGDEFDIYSNKKYNNAVYEEIKTLFIENTDTEYIKIVPIEVIRNPVDDIDISENIGYEIDYEMEPLIIYLK